MYKINCLNKISSIGTDRFDNKYEVAENLENANGIMVRSASMHDMDFSDDLLAIARAGAGVNNIPLQKCSESGIVVFNTPGANANAVKEMVICALLMSSRKVNPAIEWAKSLKGKGSEVSGLVEKGKGAFAGPEISGKKLGVIGLGAIGVLVANAANALGMKVYGYDPYISVEGAWGLSSDIKRAVTTDEIFENCDYITVHVPLLKDTAGLINTDSIAKMKDSVRILNFSRGELVVDDALLSGLESGKIACYVTDFPSDALICVDGVIAIPHLGASTPESEDNCAMMAADELMEYLENGNIINSVNMPSISLPKDLKCKRICILHKNIPNTIATFANACGDSGINIENMLSKSKGDFAYTILDVSGEVTQNSLDHLCEQDEIIKIRLI